MKVVLGPKQAGSKLGRSIRTHPIVDQWDIWERIGMPLWLDHGRLVMVELHACHS